MKRTVSVILILLVFIISSGCSNKTEGESKESTSNTKLVENSDKKTGGEKTTEEMLPESISEIETASEAVTTEMLDNDDPEITESENDRILWEVYNNERPFIFSSTNYSYSPVNSKSGSITLQEYMGWRKDENHPYVDVERYIFIDLDGDGYNELIVELYFYVEEYLIFHVSNGEVYGYPEVQKGIAVLKTDGSCVTSGMQDHDYFTYSFENNIRSTTPFIRAYVSLGIFEIDGQSRSKEEVAEAIKEWDKRENAEWVIIFHPDYSQYNDGH